MVSLNQITKLLDSDVVRAALSIIISSIVGIASLLLIREFRPSGRSMVAAFLRPSPMAELPAVKVFRTDAARMEAARYVAQITGPGDRILSATGRHDKIFANDISFYFLVQRLPGTRWHHYDPGVQTSERVQRSMIADIERFRVAVVVRDQSWDDVREPNKSAQSSGVVLLDAYLASHFQECATFGNIEVLCRRPLG